jgi:hypothetical protein
MTMIKTIIADRREFLPLFIIIPRKKIINNWITDKLIRAKRIICSLISYTNSQIALQYIEYLVKYSRAGPNKSWKILLFDRYSSHITPEFQLITGVNYIHFFLFPFLFYLYIGIFRP